MSTNASTLAERIRRNISGITKTAGEAVTAANSSTTKLEKTGKPVKDPAEQEDTKGIIGAAKKKNVTEGDTVKDPKEAEGGGGENTEAANDTGASAPALAKVAKARAAILSAVRGARANSKTAGNRVNELDEKIPANFRETLLKVATEIYSTEQGRKMFDDAAAELLGQEAARKLVADAAALENYTQQLHEKIAAEHAMAEQVAAVTQAFGARLHGAMLKSASVRTATNPAKMQRMFLEHAKILDTIPDPLVKIAYLQGVDDAGEMLPEGAEEPAPLPGGSVETPLPIEQILATIEELLQSGQITEEQVPQILAELGIDPDALAAEMAEGMQQAAGDPHGEMLPPTEEEVAAQDPEVEEAAKVASIVFNHVLS